nr:MAG TPA: nucleic-acid-binding protein [Caudoviricetes sp.]
MIWIIIAIAVFIFLNYLFDNQQKQQIKETIYTENVMVDGVPRTVQKLKCPHCGNTDLGIQLTESPDFVHMTTRKTATVYSHTNKRAVCNKCGTSFDVVKRVTPVMNFFISLLITPLICLGLFLIYDVISIILMIV